MKVSSFEAGFLPRDVSMDQNAKTCEKGLDQLREGMSNMAIAFRRMTLTGKRLDQKCKHEHVVGLEHHSKANTAMLRVKREKASDIIWRLDSGPFRALMYFGAWFPYKRCCCFHSFGVAVLDHVPPSHFDRSRPHARRAWAF